MRFFYIFSKTLLTSTTSSKIITGLLDFLSQSDGFAVNSFTNSELVFDVKNTNMPMYNSFLPTVKVTAIEGQTSMIEVSASLKKTTKVILLLLLVIASIFGLSLGIMWLSNAFSIFLVLLPFGLVLTAFLGAYLGLIISAQSIIKTIGTIVDCL